jgi:hypothetical protein
MGWGGGGDLFKFCVPHVFKVPQIIGYVGGWGGCIFLKLNQSIELILKTTRRDRVRVFAPFEIPRRDRGSSSIKKKMTRRGRDLELDHCLDPSILQQLWAILL